MAEEEPPPLQPALREAQAPGHPGDGPAQPGQHFSDKHRDPSSSLRGTLPAGHAEGEWPGTEGQRDRGRAVAELPARCVQRAGTVTRLRAELCLGTSGLCAQTLLRAQVQVGSSLSTSLVG